MVRGRSDAEIHRISAIDPWFLAKLRTHDRSRETRLLKGKSLEQLDADSLFEAQTAGLFRPTDRLGRPTAT